MMRSRRIFVLTGLPFIGKTTAVERIVASVEKPRGFLTFADWQSSHRTGLRAVNHAGLSEQIAVREGMHLILKFDTFDRFVKETFDAMDEEDVVYVDEVGGLYCRSKVFVDTLRSVIERYTCILTMSRKGHPFSWVFDDPRARVVRVDAENRDQIPADVVRDLRGM